MADSMVCRIRQIILRNQIRIIFLVKTFERSGNTHKHHISTQNLNAY
jgi:hypothetical protein